MLLGKAPSPKEVFNDYTYDAINLFTVIQDPVALRLLKAKLKESLRTSRLVDLAVPLAALEPPSPASASQYLYRKYGIASQSADNLAGVPNSLPELALERAFQFLRSTHYSEGRLASQRLSSTATDKDLEELDLVAERLRRVQLDNLAWYNLIDKYDSPETLFYIYPNYHNFSERFTARDGVSLCEEDHTQLVEALTKIKGKALVVGFSNELYARLEIKGWKRVEFILGAQGKTTLGNYEINVVWKNY